jgi:two-component system, chemotaxis family, response regulator PixG
VKYRSRGIHITTIEVFNPAMNQEIDPYSLLSYLSSSGSTGCLEVACGNTRWNVCLQFGQILSVDCSVQSLSQSIYRLYQMGCLEAAKVAKKTHTTTISGNLAGEHPIRQTINRLATQGLLSRSQTIQISTEVTKEALESLLWVQTGSWQWEFEKLADKTAINNTESRFNVSKVTRYYKRRLEIWQKYITMVQSPHQRPYSISHRLLEKPVTEGTLSPEFLSQIAQLMKGISLRELSMLLKQDELKTIQLLIPYVRESVICLREPAPPFKQLPLIPEPDLPALRLSSSENTSLVRDCNPSRETQRQQIACIDDNSLVLNEMEQILGKNSNYSLTKIKDPVKASAMIFKLKPDLILLDIMMPDINGYNLCRLFRSSATFETTPIVMVTGNKGLIDKARAKLVGATDYLTKPFTKTDLLTLVEKYLA